MPRSTSTQTRGPETVRLARPPWLHPDDYAFPDPMTALDEPNGLVAIGGDLKPQRILAAYRCGIFPWFDDDDGPPLWWSPDPRAVLVPTAVRVSRSLRKRLRRGDYRITFDRAFAEVILGCARPDRPGATGPGTWITASMAAAYRALHELGYAHSVECWRDDELVGGLYGISLGRLFFGESMFSRTDDASKVALVHLARRLHAWQFPLIDCQIQNPHLQSLGAVTISRRAFLHILADNSAWPDRVGSWTLDDDIGNEQ